MSRRRGRIGKRRDANEPAIVEALEAVGASVEYLDLKNGPDLAVGFRRSNYLFEVKTEEGRVSIGQADWHAQWRGHVCVVRSVDEALRCIGAIT